MHPPPTNQGLVKDCSELNWALIWAAGVYGWGVPKGSKYHHSKGEVTPLRPKCILWSYVEVLVVVLGSMLSTVVKSHIQNVDSIPIYCNLMGSLTRLLSNPWEENRFCGLSGTTIRAQKQKTVKTYATQQPR